MRPSSSSSRSRAAPALGLARILGLALQLDPAAIGQQLERRLEVHALGLLHEREHVPLGLAAEAVVDLLHRVDPERGRALVVERAQPLVAAGPARRSSVRAETSSTKSTASRTLFAGLLV